MAKETQKEKIERLERELAQAQEVIKKQNEQIDSMIDKADNDFENSVTYKQMQKQIDSLELKVKAVSDSVEHNKKMYNAELKRNTELIKEIQELKNEDYTLEDIKELEQKIQNARKTSDKWHTEYFNKDMKYKELDKKYNELEDEAEKLKEKNRKLKLDSEVLKEVLKKVKELEKENEQLRNTNVQKLNINVNDELEQLKKENAELKSKLNAGRKEKFTKEQQEQIIRLREEDGKSMQEIANILKCSKATIFNYLKKFNNK